MQKLPKKPIVTVYVRHRDECPHAFTREINPRTGQARRDENYPKCDCAKWLRYSLGGKQHKQPANTRTWSVAVEKADELQRQLDRRWNGEEVQLVRPSTALQTDPTITESVKTLIRRKESEHITAATIRKLKYQLQLFEDFMSKRSKFYPADISSQDLVDFRAGWKWSDLTKIKAQQNLRGFIRFACKGNHRTDLLDALGTIKETREGRERRKPKPFTEEEIKKILAQVPITLAKEPEKITRYQTMIRAMVSSGLAIIDTVQLQRAAIEKAKRTGVLEVERQKTSKTAIVPVDKGLIDELMSVLNGNPRYVFWHGQALADSETRRLQGEMRELMQDAGVYIKGNVFHRFRDTAVDSWLGHGWSLTDVATGLGDTLTVVEKHYKDWASQRLKDRVAKLPVRRW